MEVPYSVFANKLRYLGWVINKKWLIVLTTSNKKHRQIGFHIQREHRSK
jgi:hypothetical protein